ncbi:MAG: HAMP domain-containing sensor histidine kinase, partial [Rubripirellula sp.]
MKPEIIRAYRDGESVTIQRAVEVSTHTVSGSTLRWVEGNDLPPYTQISSRQVSSVEISDANGTRKALSYVPLNMDGSPQGTIEVTQPLDAHDAFTWGSVIASLLSLIGVAGLSALVIYLGGVQLVGKPLDKLITQVNSIGNGRLAQGPVLQSNDELGRLASAISQMSHRLSQQRDTIRHTDRLGTVGTLAAGVAHELGTPLNVVSGRAGLIASGKLSAEEVKSSAETIKSESERMTTIIRQLLDFARQKPAPHATVDLRQIVAHTCQLMQPLANKSNVSIHFDTSADSVMVDGDATQLQQVLTNLLSNAIAA